MQIDPSKLVQARMGRAMSQEEVAIATDLSARTIQRIEAGHRASLESTKALLSLFNLEILGDPDECLAVAELPTTPLVNFPRLGRHMASSAAIGWAGLRILFVLTFLGVAIGKILSPSHAGMWMDDGHRSLFAYGYGTMDPATVGIHEVLGLWFIPINILLALGLALTFGRFRSVMRSWRNAYAAR